MGIGGVAAVAFVLLLAGYSVKLVTAFAAARAGFRHPIAGYPFGTVLISLLLLPIVLEPFARHLILITLNEAAATCDGEFLSRPVTDTRAIAATAIERLAL